MILDPQTGAPATHALSPGASQIFAVREDGALIVGTADGSGVARVAALDGDGTVVWTGPDARAATIANDGTVVAFGTAITALAGATKWAIPPASPGSCIFDAALTSTGAIVALQCDGTMFGAGD